MPPPIKSRDYYSDLPSLKHISTVHHCCVVMASWDGQREEHKRETHNKSYTYLTIWEDDYIYWYVEILSVLADFIMNSSILF